MINNIESIVNRFFILMLINSTRNIKEMLFECFEVTLYLKERQIL